MFLHCLIGEIEDWGHEKSNIETMIFTNFQFLMGSFLGRQRKAVDLIDCSSREMFVMLPRLATEILRINPYSAYGFGY